MKSINLIFKTVLISMVLFTACKSANKDSAGVAEMATEVTEESSIPVTNKMAAENDNASTTAEQNPIPIDRKLIKEADLEWETNNIDNTHKNIVQLSKQYGAYIADDNQYKDDYSLTNRMLVKVPSDKFDEFLSALNKDVKKYDRKTIKALDVTEEYVDVETRIKTKKELEQRYIEILKKANKIEDILTVEAQINAVRTDIETAEARMKMLNHQITLSSINISFYETTSAPVGFFGKLGKSFVEGWNGMLYFVLGIISVWPAFLIIGLVVYFIFKKRNK